MEERVLSLNQKSRLIKSLPSAIRSCVEDGGWQIVMPRNTSSFTIMTEEEFINIPVPSPQHPNPESISECIS
jgi:hypothetical protein